MLRSTPGLGVGCFALGGGFLAEAEGDGEGVVATAPLV
jgi:hypothetical protein